MQLQGLIRRWASWRNAFPTPRIKIARQRAGKSTRRKNLSAMTPQDRPLLTSKITPAQPHPAPGWRSWEQVLGDTGHSSRIHQLGMGGLNRCSLQEACGWELLLTTTPTATDTAVPSQISLCSSRSPKAEDQCDLDPGTRLSSHDKCPLAVLLLYPGPIGLPMGRRKR